jgi:ribosome modulation factor
MDEIFDSWSEGYKAAMEENDKGKLGETMCPYEKGTLEYEKWQDGYDTGMDDWYYSQYV